MNNQVGRELGENQLELLCTNKENGQNIYVGVFSFQNWEVVAKKHEITNIFFEEGTRTRAAKYESLDGFDTININLIDYRNLRAAQRKVIIYLTKEKVLFFCEDSKRVFPIVKECISGIGEKVSLERIISDFLNSITRDVIPVFDLIEKEILDLEQGLITLRRRECVKEIISLRNRLMILKKYYEQFLNILDGMNQNENEIFDNKKLRYYRTLEKRVSRYYQNVLNLRDYVTQVRESYQAEVDISLNNTMRIFTVVTTIFLPLTLIVGWYGMNLPMPEYDWEHSYAMVIMLSILVILASVIFFKKKKWF